MDNSTPRYATLANCRLKFAVVAKRLNCPVLLQSENIDAFRYCRFIERCSVLYMVESELGIRSCLNVRREDTFQSARISCYRSAIVELVLDLMLSFKRKNPSRNRVLSSRNTAPK